ncbi:MAG: helix-turn-helix domain-containing protein [Clostridium sp.]
MSRVGERIKEARLKANITQKVLAKKLGVAEKYINEIELGRKVAQESFITKASKVLGVDLNDISMVVTDEALMEERKTQEYSFKSKTNKSTKIEKNELWTDAFASVLKKVPIYDLEIKDIRGYKELPIYSNKVEGHSQDKVIYLEVTTDEMVGFRMAPGDKLFAHFIKEVNKNGFYLIAYNGQRKIREIKKLDGNKALLLYNRGSVMTETVDLRSIEVIAKIERIEITL